MLASGHQLEQEATGLTSHHTSVKAVHEHSGFQNSGLLVECRYRPLRDNSVSYLRVQGPGCDTAGHPNGGGVLQDILSSHGHPAR